MARQIVQALLACAVTFVLCAIVYPVVVWGLAWLAFPHEAEGSLVYSRDRTVIGSALIAQPFASDRYFSPRPSAAGPNGYAADAASGSNLGTKNPALKQRIAADAARQILQRTGDADLNRRLERLDTLQAELKAKNEIKDKTDADARAIADLENQVAGALARASEQALALARMAKDQVPTDLVTTSASGLDPDISPEAAYYQSDRVAAARKLPVSRVRDLIDRHVNRSGAIIGAPPRVNVLELNLDLDAMRPEPSSVPGAVAAPPTNAEEGGVTSRAF
jgi:K+-transporting ATPase ATPase C chain